MLTYWMLKKIQACERMYMLNLRNVDSETLRLIDQSTWEKKRARPGKTWLKAELQINNSRVEARGIELVK